MSCSTYLRKAAEQPRHVRIETLETRLLLHKQGISDPVHQWITREAYFLYASQFVGTDLVNHMAAPNLSPTDDWELINVANHEQNWNNNVLEGARDEDEVLEWTDPLIGPFVHHFVAGGDILTDGDELYDGLLGYYSAYQRAMEKNQFWNKAITGRGNYWYLGRVAHLIQDMTMPAHVHNDQHALYDAYEAEISDNDANDPIWFKSYTWRSARTQSIPLYNTFESLFRETVDYTDDYDSDNAKGDYSLNDHPFDDSRLEELGLSERHQPIWVDNSYNLPREIEGYNFYGLPDYSLKVLANDLMPWAIEQTAALFRYFYHKIDNIAPTVRIITTLSSDVLNPTIIYGSLDLLAHATDSLSGADKNGYRLLTQKAGLLDWEWQKDWGRSDASISANLVPGLYRVRVQAEDGAGNFGMSPWRYVQIEPRVDTPTIVSVSPETLAGTASGQRKTITIIGRNFADNATLLFSRNGGSPIASNPAHIRVSPTRIEYDFPAGPEGGTWSVQVCNSSTVRSDPATFTVTAATVPTAPQSDLIVQNLTVSPSNAKPGDAVTISFDIKNRGGGSAMPFKTSVRLSLSPDAPSYNDPALIFEMDSPATLASQGVVSVSKTVKIPAAAAGQYYIWVTTDVRNTANQSNTDNDRAKTPFGVLATTGGNTPPVISAVADQALASNISKVINFTLSDAETAAGSLLVVAAASDPSLFQSLIIGGSGVNRTLTITPATGRTGSAVVAISALDGGGLLTTQSFRVTIGATQSQAGSIRVYLPTDAAAAGAQWRLTTETNWRDSGTVATGLPVGPYIITFKPISGFSTPNDRLTNVLANEPVVTLSVGEYWALPQVGGPSPANGAVNVGRTDPVTFSWGRGEAGTRYRLTLMQGQNVLWQSGYFDADVCQAQYHGTLQPGTVYQWQVTAQDVRGGVSTGPMWSFTTQYDMADLVPADLTLSGDIRPGSTVTATLKVKNQGTFAGPNARAYFYLSSTPGSKERRLYTAAVEVPVLQGGQEMTFTRELKLDGLPAGRSYIEVWVDPSTGASELAEANITNNLRSVAVDYADMDAPVITTFGFSLSNAKAKTGNPCRLLYAASDDIGITGVSIYSSVDDGATWQPIVEGYVPAYSPQYGENYIWNVPADFTVTSNLKLKLVVSDAGGHTAEALAGPYEVISGLAPTVRILSPNGGEIWDMGSTHEIKWEVLAPNGIATMDLYYECGDTSWHIADIRNNTTGRYTWTVPQISTASSKIRIKVCDMNYNESQDSSDVVFTIQDTSAPPPAPWSAGQQMTISGTNEEYSVPVLAMDAQGVLHAGYMSSIQHITSGGATFTTTIYYRTLANGIWSEPEQVYSVTQSQTYGVPGTLFDISSLQIAVSSNGAPHFVWTQTNRGGDITINNSREVFYSSRDGGQWVTPINLSANSTVSSQPTIQVDSDGAVDVLWRDGTSWNADYTMNGVTSLYHRKRNSSGDWQSVSIAPEVKGGLLNSGRDTSGNLIITFVNDENRLGFREWNGQSWSAEYLAPADFPPCNGPYVFTNDALDNKHFAYFIYDDAVHESSIYYISEKDGVWTSPELIRVSQSSYSSLSPRAVVGDSQGRPHVIFDTSGQEGDYWIDRKLYTARIDGQWTTPVQLNLRSQFNLYDGVAAMGGDDNIHVLWSGRAEGHNEIFYSHADLSSDADMFAPSVSIKTPWAGQTLSPGGVFEVKWEAQDNRGVLAIDLAYSLDNGNTWSEIASGLANSSSYSWTVPGFAGSAIIRATAHDAAGNAAAAYSGTFSTADVTPPDVSILSPTAGTQIDGGSVYAIQWSATDNAAVEFVDLEYSLDDGATWNSIGAQLENTGRYDWEVPAANTLGMRIRVTATDSSGLRSIAVSDAATVMPLNHAPAQPIAPFPVLGSGTTASLSPLLAWSGGDIDGDFIAYEVQLGTTPDVSTIAYVLDSEFEPGELAPNTTYYWRVVASDGMTTTAGLLWSFTTGAAPAAPRISAVTVDDGSAQRSKISTITVALDKPVQYQDGAFILKRRDGTVIPIVVQMADDEGLVYVIRVTGADLVGGSLKDGFYDLTVKGGLVQDRYGQALSEGDQTVSFHRYFGDFDGDRDVDFADMFEFRKVYGKAAPDPQYDSRFDVDSDGDVDLADQNAFKLNYQKRLEPPVEQTLRVATAATSSSTTAQSSTVMPPALSPAGSPFSTETITNRVVAELLNPVDALLMQMR